MSQYIEKYDKTMNWNTKDVIKLIKLYKQYECLWNIKSKNYKYLDNKKYAWLQISRECNRNVTDVKRKVKYIRTAYLVEKKKVDASKKTSSVRGIYTPHLFYFDDLNFLDSVIVQRKAYDTSFIKDIEVPDQNEESVQMMEYIKCDEYLDGNSTDIFQESFCDESNVMKNETQNSIAISTHNNDPCLKNVIPTPKRKHVPVADISEGYLEPEEARHETSCIELALKDTEKSDLHFFQSLLPYMSKFTDLEKLEIKGDVLKIIGEKLKYKEQQQKLNIRS
ncbi:uncharacterized protein LOC119668578 [Teleopsis dalmanni]|uniref:uncharacterized protein LOC119668578 n=1 Tax=Teleopsis dalmanni TaxID=139649 RepID=UPI0018CE232C|nr:uncharacterized protein LOC119668578 [Teleopsis dalmanni]